MTNIIIVDENDKQIRVKERGTIELDDTIRTSALWITNSKGQILLAQRKKNKKYNPGMWGPAVGGTNDEGETYESNIYKEADEEIGLSGEKFTIGPKFYIEKPNKRFCQIFFLVLDWNIDRFTIQEEEVEQIKWFDREDLLKSIKETPEDFTTPVGKLLMNIVK
jgi:isopentenyldiphosphate isomerase